MKIFYDTEFLEDGPDEPIRLISIGMVAEDGRELYRVVKSPSLITDATKHPWLSENVIPHLPVKAAPYGHTGAWDWDRDHTDWPRVAYRPHIAEDVAAFILAVPDPELWADYCAYDHVALCQLFGRMIDLPEGVPMWTNDLRQLARLSGRTSLPSLEGLTAHNALDDAREVKFRYEWLTSQGTLG